MLAKILEKVVFSTLVHKEILSGEWTTDNPRQPPLEAREGGETPEGAGRQTLDDATFEPLAQIEQTGDFQQAEAVQTAPTALVDSTASARDTGVTPQPIPRPEDSIVKGSLPAIRGDIDRITADADDGRLDATPIPLPGKEGPAGATPITLPQMRVQPEEEEEGHPPEPPNLDHNPHPDAMMKAPESGSLRDRMPKIRGDLDQATAGGGGKHEATPINLPGPENAAADEIRTIPVFLPGEKSGPALIPENDMMPHAGSGGETDILPESLPCRAWKERRPDRL
ncbi:MAG: hypothetical protein JW929_04065 [Anaerolineales bacterium]|nr:hypothetical protein [Anaerolineales bacterium]